MDDVNLRIDSNEIFGLIGESGSGKSTLLRCINRLEYFERGNITCDGEDIKSLDEVGLRNLRKKIGMIFQGFSLVNRKTVYENIALPMRIHGYSNDKIDRKVNELANLIGLDNKLQEKPSTLSGGQKQRVAIARALTLNPKYLLCDECTSALDPNNTNLILKLLKSINENLGITIIIVTHEMDIIKKVCDKVAILQNGKILGVSKVLDLFLKRDFSVGNFLDLERNELSKDGVDITLVLENIVNENYFFYDLSKVLSEKYNLIDCTYLDTKDGKHCKIIINVSSDDINSLENYLKNRDIYYIKDSRGGLC